MAAGKGYAAVLRDLTQNYISEGSRQRQELLRSLGPQVERVMRELLKNENLKIAIMPLGSTL